MYKIVCPHCGAEYLPQEIFVLSDFNKSDIIKDENGKILDNIEYDTYESYRCDYCDKTFQATMGMAFEVTYTKTPDPYTTKLHKPALFLEEE